MEYVSSPANWFLREKTMIVGLNQLGIRSISKQKNISIALPEEKDGIVFDSIHDGFFQDLADYGKGIEEVCIPPTIKIRAKRGAYEKPFPATCSFKKLTLMSIEHFNSNYIWFRLNDVLEAVSLPNDSEYETKDGVIYSKDCTVVVYYPRSKPGDTFVLPETVTNIAPHAFQDTKLLKKLVCSRELMRVCERAFDNSSITELITPSGTIKDNVELKDGFANCRFTIPQKVPAFTHE